MWKDVEADKEGFVRGVRGHMRALLLTHIHRCGAVIAGGVWALEVKWTSICCVRVESIGTFRQLRNWEVGRGMLTRS